MRIARATLAFLALAGCTRIEGEIGALEAVLYRTETAARSFTYTEEADGRTTVVRGVISDDHRYSLEATVDGRPAVAEVVYDDARAYRVDDPAFLPAGAAFPLGRWVLDPSGAADLAAATRTPPAGSDPLADALTVLRTTRTSAREAASVLRFNDEATGYRPELDPFPRPGRDQIRYTASPPPLDPLDPAVAAAGALAPPGPVFFRRAAVYVSDGFVVRVRERISVRDTLTDPGARVAARIGDYGMALPAGASLAAQARALLDQINASASRLGRPPLRERDVDVTFRRSGASVALPPDADTGSLAGIRPAGQLLYERAR